MRRKHQLRPDNFPFLAVLLCAMGSLILVLMEMDRRARSNAHNRAEAAWKQQEQEKAELRARLRAQKIAELQQHRDAALASHQKERDDLQARHKTLTAEQQQTQAQIDALLNAIAAGREQLQRAEQQRQQLQNRAETTKGVLTARQAQTEQVQHRLKAAHAQRDRMAADLLALEESLRRLQEQKERERQKWSVVPYVGKRGLSRRPLYVEIANDKIIFYPDRLSLSGFLLSDQRVRDEVRSRGEAHKKNAPAGAPVEEPYWMLLVRPDGIETYYGFLAAVKSMELTYGYEFVEKDWDFDFSDPKSAPAPVEVVTPLPTPARPTLGRPRVGGAAGNANGGGDTVAGVTSPGGGQGIGPPGGGGYPTPRSGGNDSSGEGSGNATAGSASGHGRDSIGIGSIGLPPATVGPPGGSGQGDGAKGTEATGNAALPSGTKPGNNGTVPPTPAQEEGAEPKPATTPRVPPNPVADPSASGEAGVEGSGSDGQGSKSPTEEVPTQSGSRGQGNAVKGSKKPPKIPPRLRPEWVLVVDCRADGVLLSPSREFFSLSDLARCKEAGKNRLARIAGKLIAQRRALSAPGEPPPTIVIRFLVRQETLRTYHLTYPLLDALDAEKRAVMSTE